MNEKCTKCPKKAEIKSKTDNLCKTCFLEKIEKRARKQLREYIFLNKDDKVLIIDNDSKESATNKYLFGKIIKGFPAKIIVKKFENEKAVQEYVKKEKINRIVIPKNADDLLKEQLENLLMNKKEKKNENEIVLLAHVLDSEIEEFAKLLNLKYTKKEKKTNLMIDEFEKLEEKYPGAKFGFLKSQKELN